ncbi:hypothetical protein N474_19695 [Pseudoalteromonas luteoviolacea CPMOR-2]|uniref:Uncharacterized protein n=1 Tax=Pseudoalteromonas luteoviolacea DSM 6061 TaxID=1365250 RepID=A0A166VYU1_9GAMM|nr:SDR family NAD(P)-dependent oxidoreductase [Pseudoalteromonas luteoviolacea]KZN34632.1 hypothetical protein N475_19000 [Pseudoalteromonas luteoviolacea DSM 6061]KZN53797.1 hypothetical protein N474_19695 [Pseudoalteromonas luteoviolacea CPMOR-2]MBE0389622.1 hypothetical protein [Pseudoalteromonas luteoviolacea DSM 6061]
MNKVALISGANRGIGKAVASSLAKQGNDLILVARNQADIEDLAETLQSQYQIKVATIICDIRDVAESSDQITATIAQMGGLDLLVHSAGIFHYGTSIVAKSQLHELFDINVVGAQQLTNICLPAIKDTKGRIVFISSVTGLQGFAPVGGYAASKFALVGYAQSLAKELLDCGVKVTTLCPDVVNTDMGKPSGLADEQMIDPQDICTSIDYLSQLSDAVVIEQITLKCRVIEQMMNVRK